MNDDCKKAILNCIAHELRAVSSVLFYIQFYNPSDKYSKEINEISDKVDNLTDKIKGLIVTNRYDEFFKEGDKNE